jgi:hypothetical protein
MRITFLVYVPPGVPGRFLSGQRQRSRQRQRLKTRQPDVSGTSAALLTQIWPTLSGMHIWTNNAAIYHHRYSKSVFPEILGCA